MTKRKWNALVAAACLLPMLSVAQAARVYTDADYAKAVRQLGPYTAPLVDHAVRSATWLDGTRFWYADAANGVQTIMVGDARKGTKAAAFDPAGMAAALHAGGLPESDPQKISVSGYEPEADGTAAVLTVQGRRFRCGLGASYACKEQVEDAATHARSGRRSATMAVLSPNGKRSVFVREWNLWMRDEASGAEKQLTTDGVKDFGYATDNAGWTHSDRAVVLWSPDSKLVATFQQDQRKTGEMYLVSTNVGHPKLESWKYPLVGDKDVTLIERVVIDVDAGRTVRLQTPPDQHRSTLCDDVSCHGGWDDVQWAADAKSLAFVSVSRDHKEAKVRIADPGTGAVREVFREAVPTFFESGYADESVNWRYLSQRNEILWWSQRSNWGQLYLYDAGTGKLKRPVTEGAWNVDHIVSLDEKSGAMLLAGVGREAGVDSYYRQIYSTNLNGAPVKRLSPEAADHIATASADGRYFVDLYSTPQEPQTAVLRDAEGRVKTELAKGDLTRLQQTEWKAPANVQVPCSDGKTICYGLLFRPAGLDEGKKYPVIDYIYPGPFTGSIPSRQFAGSFGDSNALAQLGFAVVMIDGMGTPRRSKTFQDTYVQRIGEQALPDQVSGIRDLAAKNPWMDLTRVGIWGHSGGGNATAASMFRYPDFYRAGIAESGDHENRNYEDDWDEKYVGLLRRSENGTTNYDSQSNASLAKNLKGKLLLAHGMMDDNVPWSNTMLVVDALVKANKDFELVVFPDAHHGYGESSLYMMRRRWDFFLTNLMEATPPREFQIKLP